MKKSVVRSYVATAVSLLSLAVALYSMWLVVPFVEGEARSPIWMTWNHFAPTDMRVTGSFSSVSTQSFFWPLWQSVMYYVYGIVGFLAQAGLISIAGRACARTLEVGFPEFMREEREAYEREREQAAIEATRERRRERRLARLRAADRSDCNGVGIGVAIGLLVAWLL
ncbi:hypothetical protein [Paraburkholderia phytofirmans]|uniref:Transmembrane protein n=1 Tax=Paraburkholderia phytofirmans (strain DSM 17436 / LMG 22146 / PsJN) TaxID=398527 RepID=B2TGU7_PARPJ|nr:hypothetical protein [Paraburkholderia phytofirmans]ACD21663.1 hypothetical protein Bphyt_7378 [Paraburkholderia phytofirmans PsJN]